MLKTQVWIAIAIYTLIAIAKKKFMIKHSLYEILQIISISIFDKKPINQVFEQQKIQKNIDAVHNQLKLWE